MDALKDIPDEVERLETLKGTARLQKTDIFKRLMWFSYPKDDNWIPVAIDRVREIQKLNKAGVKPEDLRDEAVELDAVPVPKVLDYENVVGQDSITRLDERRTNNKKKKKRSGNGNKPPQEGGAVVVKAIQPAAPAAIAGAPAKPEGGPANPNSNPNRNKNRNKRRFNNNKPKPNE
jgi:hypothetical protein